jgi:phospholipid/cholesterol/gamma-HCH transport system substrate-binding protein
MNRAWAVPAVAIGALLATAGAAIVRSDHQDRIVAATFHDASPLEVGSQVRAAGVRVGTVRSIRLARGSARVELNLDPAVVPIHRDATLTVKPVNLLGETYLDLDAGSDDQPYLTGTLPSSQTSSSVTLQDVLNTFDDPTSTGLAALVTTLGQGLDGNGRQVAAAIRALAPTMRDAQKLGALLEDQNQVLAALIDRSAPVASALADHRGESLDQLLGTTTALLTSLAEQQDGVEQTLENLPGTLVAARKSLDEVTALSDSAGPTLKDAREVTRKLPELSEELQDFSDSADPALKSLEPVLQKADDLFSDASPLVHQLGLRGTDLVETSKTLGAAGQELLDDHLADLMAFVRKWALSTNGRDGLSHYFRGVMFASPESLKVLLGGFSLPSADGTPAGTASAAESSDEGAKAPAAGTASILPKAPSSSTPPKDPTDATGLKPEQERSIVGQLLGGVL